MNSEPQSIEDWLKSNFHRRNIVTIEKHFVETGGGMYDLQLETELFYLVLGNILHKRDQCYGGPKPSKRVQWTIQRMPLGSLEYENFRNLLTTIRDTDPESRSIITSELLAEFDILIEETETLSNLFN